MCRSKLNNKIKKLTLCIMLIIALNIDVAWAGTIEIIEIIETKKLTETTETIKASEEREKRENAKAEILALKINAILGALEELLATNYPYFLYLAAPNIKCDQKTKICNIDIKNLSEQALLPENFDNYPILGEKYYIRLKRSGIIPNNIFSGVLIVESKELTPSYMKKVKDYMDQNEENNLMQAGGKRKIKIGSWKVLLVDPSRR